MNAEQRNGDQPSEQPEAPPAGTPGVTDGLLAGGTAPLCHDVAEVADLLRLPERTVLELVASGALSAKVIAGTTLIPAASLQALLSDAPDAAAVEVHGALAHADHPESPPAAEDQTEPDGADPKGAGSVNGDSWTSRRYRCTELRAAFRELLDQPDAFAAGLIEEKSRLTFQFTPAEGSPAAGGPGRA